MPVQCHSDRQDPTGVLVLNMAALGGVRRLRFSHILRLKLDRADP
jgi:hypothetical protein